MDNEFEFNQVDAALPIYGDEDCHRSQLIQEFPEVIENIFIAQDGVDIQNAFNKRMDNDYWYSANDIKTIGEQLIKNQSHIKFYEPVSDDNSLKKLLKQMKLDITNNMACISICNVGGNHWITLAMVQSGNEKYLLYKNSMRANQFSLNQIAGFVTELNDVTRPNEFHFRDNNSCEQYDDASCGIFALQNAVILADKIQLCMDNPRSNLQEFVNGFRGNGNEFCNQGQVDNLRNNKFAEQYILGKYFNAEFSHSECDLHKKVRQHHVSELYHIKDALTNLLLARGIENSIIIDSESDEEMVHDADAIKLEIAIDNDMPFRSRNYSYNYRLSWNEDNIIQNRLTWNDDRGTEVNLARIIEAFNNPMLYPVPQIDTEEENTRNQSITRNSSKVLKLFSLPITYQHTKHKLNFSTIPIDQTFNLSLNEFLNGVIYTTNSVDVRSILDRNSLAYINDYVVPIMPVREVRTGPDSDYKQSVKPFKVIASKNYNNIQTDYTNIMLLSLDDKDVNNVVGAIKELKPFLSSNTKVKEAFIKKIKFSQENKLNEIRSLLIINALLETANISDFEYKIQPEYLQKAQDLMIATIKDHKSAIKIGLCSTILILAGDKHQFVANMEPLQSEFIKMKPEDKSFASLSKLIIAYAEHKFGKEHTLSEIDLKAISHVLPSAFIGQDIKLTNKIREMFDTVLRDAVFKLKSNELSKSQQDNEYQKIRAYAEAATKINNIQHHALSKKIALDWQSNLLDKLARLIKAKPDIKYVNEIEKLLEDNPGIRQGREYIFSQLLETLTDRFPQCTKLISDLSGYQTSDSRTNISEQEDINNSGDNEISIDQAFLANNLSKQYNKILTMYQSDSKLLPQGSPICNWQEIKILEFSKAFKDLAKEKGQNKIDEDQILELLAVIKKANIIASGNDPRSTQMLSILLMLKLSDIGSLDQGMLLQIATGEGKSTITAILAAVKAMQGHKVDIVTSSKVLAKRDAEDREKCYLFEMLDLTSSSNTEMADSSSKIKKQKQCYKADIVYGDVSSFQYDWIYHNFKDYGTRGDRKHDVVIVDEVDSMLIDESAKIALISSSLPGAEYMQPIYAAMWQFMSVVDHQTVLKEGKYSYVKGGYKLEDGKIVLDDPDNGGIYQIDMEINEFRKQRLDEYTKDLVISDKIEVPNHLKQHAVEQASQWTKSLLKAKSMSLEKDYVITANEDGRKIIAPVDYAATGVISQSQWVDGIHQFLQLKHSLKLTSETLTTSYISNKHYFNLYGTNIYGMSGTLGSKEARNLLSEIYKVEILDIPTYKLKIFEESGSYVATDKANHLELINSAVSYHLSQGRAILIISESILQAKEIHQLLQNHVPSSKLKLYTRVDNDEVNAIAGDVEVGDVIVATNLAGRGTDLKTSLELEENKGLHIIVTYLPTNLRVEEQAFGRTSRQGNQGSAELILNIEDIEASLGQLQLAADINIREIKALRDHFEINRIKQAKFYDSRIIDLEDNLFADFIKFYYQLKAVGAKNEEALNCDHKLPQLEERFGFLLKAIKHTNAKDKLEIKKLLEEDDFENIAKQHVEALTSNAWKLFNDFKEQTSAEFNCDLNIMRNGFWLVRAAVNAMGKENGYNNALKLLDKALKIETNNYSFAAHYTHAYALISQESFKCKEQGKAMTAYIGEAHKDMNYARHYIQDFIIPNIEAIAILSTEAGETDLLKQVQTRIKLMKLYVEHIDKVCNKLEKFRDDSGRKYIEVSENKLLQEYFPEDDIPNDEIKALTSLGLGSLFDVAEAEIPINYMDAFFVAVLGCIQIVVGVALTCIGLVSVGTSLVMDGVGDLVKAYQICQGKEFNWKDYFSNKAMQVVTNVIALGVEKLAAYVGLKLFDGTQKAMSLPKALETIAVRGAVIYGVGKAIDHVQNQIIKDILEEFEGKIHHAIEKKINEELDSANFQERFEVLMALDKANGNNRFEMELREVSYNHLKNKSSAIMSVLKGVLDKIGASNTTVGSVAKVASFAMTSHEVMQAISQVESLAEEVAEAINEKANELVTKAGSIEYYLQHKLGLQAQSSKAKEMGKILKEKGFVKAGTGICKRDEIVGEKILASKKDGGLQFLELPSSLKDMERIVIDSIISLHEHQNGDYSQEFVAIKGSVTAQVESATKNKLRQHVGRPILNEATKELRHHASEGIHNVYDFCFHRDQYEARKVQKEQEKEQEEKIKQQKIRETEQGLAANDNALRQEQYQQAAGGQEGGERGAANKGKGSGQLEEKGYKPASKQYKAPRGSSDKAHGGGQDEGRNKDKSGEHKVSDKGAAEVKAGAGGAAIKVAAANKTATEAPATNGAVKAVPTSAKPVNANKAPSAAAAITAKQKPFYVTKDGNSDNLGTSLSPALLKALVRKDTQSHNPQDPNRFSISNMMSEIFGIQAAYGFTPGGMTPAMVGIEGALTLAPGAGIYYGTQYMQRAVLATAAAASEIALPIALPAAVLGSTLALDYRSGQDYAKNIERWGSTSDTYQGVNVKVRPEDHILANTRGVFDYDNPHDLEAISRIARGVAIEREIRSGNLAPSAANNQAQRLPIWSPPKVDDFSLLGGFNQSAAPAIIKASDLPELNPFVGYKGVGSALPSGGQSTGSAFSSSNEFISSSQAAPSWMASIAAGAPVSFGDGLYGARGLVRSAGAAAVRVNPYVVATAAGGALLAQGLHNAAKLESEHVWLHEDFNDMMMNPFISSSIKNEMFQKMQSDPLLVGGRSQSATLESTKASNLSSSQVTSNVFVPIIKASDLPQLNPFAGYKSVGIKASEQVGARELEHTATMPAAAKVAARQGVSWGASSSAVHSSSSSSNAGHKSQAAAHGIATHSLASSSFSRAILEAEWSMPGLLSFPIYEKPPSILSTPDAHNIRAQWNKLPGFEVYKPNAKDLLEGFDAHDYDGFDIFEKHKQSGNNKPSSGAKKQEVYVGSPNDHDPEEGKNSSKDQSKLDNEARKLNLRKDDPTEKKILENLDSTVEEFIVKDRKGSIRKVLPGELLNLPLRDIVEKAKNGDRAARTAYKLLKQARFSK